VSTRPEMPQIRPVSGPRSVAQGSGAPMDVSPSAALSEPPKPPDCRCAIQAVEIDRLRAEVGRLYAHLATQPERNPT
jgi:hypothetical protein